MDKYCVDKTYTIQEIMEQLEETKNRVVIVVNESKKVIGIVSQGDIIRALQQGATIYTEVYKIMQPSYYHIYEYNLEEAYQIFKQYKISLLPVIDHENKLVNVITLENIFSYLEERTTK